MSTAQLILKFSLINYQLSIARSLSPIKLNSLKNRLKYFADQLQLTKEKDLTNYQKK
jgi:hypothetical protein